jgi:hypothetical protein
LSKLSASFLPISTRADLNHFHPLRRFLPVLEMQMFYFNVAAVLIAIGAMAKLLQSTVDGFYKSRERNFKIAMRIKKLKANTHTKPSPNSTSNRSVNSALPSLLIMAFGSLILISRVRSESPALSSDFVWCSIGSLLIIVGFLVGLFASATRMLADHEHFMLRSLSDETDHDAE